MTKSGASSSSTSVSSIVEGLTDAFCSTYGICSMPLSSTGRRKSPSIGDSAIAGDCTGGRSFCGLLRNGAGGRDGVARGALSPMEDSADRLALRMSTSDNELGRSASTAFDVGVAGISTAELGEVETVWLSVGTLEPFDGELAIFCTGLARA